MNRDTVLEAVKFPTDQSLGPKIASGSYIAMQASVESPSPPQLETRKRVCWMRHTPNCLGLLALSALFVALRWQNYDAPLIRDEGEYAYSAQLLLSGKLPYAHAFLQKPPMVVYTYALAQLLAPHVFWMPRILAALSAAGCTLVLGWIMRLEFGSRSVFPALWLFTPMLLMPRLEQSTANTEMFMLLPSLGVFALYTWERHRPSRDWIWPVAGALSAAAVLYKYTVVPLLAALWAAWLIEKLRSEVAWKRVIRLALLSAAGFFAAGLLILAPFLLSDGGRSMWECTIAFNRCYTGTGIFGLDALYIRLSDFWTHWRVLFLLPLLLLFLKEPPRLRFWLWICAAAWVSTAASGFSQYYIVAMPFWAMVCGIAVANSACLIARRAPGWEALARSLFTACVVLSLCLPIYPFMRPGGWKISKYNPANPFPESIGAAERVQKLTEPGDPVFIAGSEPQILYYAQRESATRFVITYPLMIPSVLAEGFQKAAIDELKQRPPKVVVLANSNSSWLDQAGTPRTFRKFIDSMLYKEYECLGGYVLGADSGHWTNSLAKENMDQVSLVLYRRKLRGLADSARIVLAE